MENNNVPIPEVNRHVILQEDPSLMIIDCIINPRYLKCFGLNVNINKVYDELCIIHQLLIKCVPRNVYKQTAEITNIWLVDSNHPNANWINKHKRFKSEIVLEMARYMSNPLKTDFDLYEYCKNPYKSYSGDRINIAIMKLVNEISFWDFDEGYWFDLSKISIDIGSADEIYDHKKEEMISTKKAKRRFVVGSFLDILKNPISKILEEKEITVVHSAMNILQKIGV